MDEIKTNKDAPVDNKITETPPTPKNRLSLTIKETRIIHVVVATLLPLLFLSTIYCIFTLHQLSNQFAEMIYYIGTIENRAVSIENKQTEFQGQLNQLGGKLTALADSPVLKEVETLAPRVTLLEKELSSIHVRQKVSPVRSKPLQAQKKKYYEIQEGDNLFRISKKYGMTVEERVLNVSDHFAACRSSRTAP